MKNIQLFVPGARVVCGGVSGVVVAVRREAWFGFEVLVAFPARPWWVPVSELMAA